MLSIDTAADRRERLRLLDQCLDLLEQAHERDIAHVNPTIAGLLHERMSNRVPVGTPVSDAIEAVLEEQELYMVQLPEESGSRQRDDGEAPSFVLPMGTFDPMRRKRTRRSA